MNVRSSLLLVVAIALVLLTDVASSKLMPITSSVKQQQCGYTANYNITAEDITPAKFTVSSFDCCTLCWANPKCKAAVYSNYLCHQKADDKPLVKAVQTVVVSPQFPTPAPTPVPSTPSPTPSPTFPPPPPPPPTEPPTPQPQPPQPPSGQNVTIYRRMHCNVSTSCDAVEDLTCTAKLYYSGVCYGKEKHTCTPVAINTDVYPQSQCQGSPQPGSGGKDFCTADYNGHYIGHYCDSALPPVIGEQITELSCGLEKCGSPDCSQYIYYSGQCDNGKKLYCMPDAASSSGSNFGTAGYIMVENYNTNDCSSGTLSSMDALPLGACTGTHVVEHGAQMKKRLAREPDTRRNT